MLHPFCERFRNGQLTGPSSTSRCERASTIASCLDIASYPDILTGLGTNVKEQMLRIRQPIPGKLGTSWTFRVFFPSWGKGGRKFNCHNMLRAGPSRVAAALFVHGFGKRSVTRGYRKPWRINRLRVVLGLASWPITRLGVVLVLVRLPLSLPG